MNLLPLAPTARRNRRERRIQDWWKNEFDLRVGWRLTVRVNRNLDLLLTNALLLCSAAVGF